MIAIGYILVILTKTLLVDIDSFQLILDVLLTFSKASVGDTYSKETSTNKLMFSAKVAISNSLHSLEAFNSSLILSLLDMHQSSHS